MRDSSECALDQGRVLKAPANAWKIARADRAAVLIDAAHYFGALREAMKKAEKSILIVGWDINSRTRLVGESGRVDDSMPDTLGDFMTALVRAKPQLRIKLLLWDYSIFYSLEREFLPFLALQWKTPRQIELCLDDTVPIGSAHHQKIVVIDDKVAFSGGLDLTIRRWDCSKHSPDNPCRTDPAGAPYAPFHDVQMLVDGPVARSLAELVRDRWWEATSEKIAWATSSTDPWPRSIAPDFSAVEVAISRTVPHGCSRTEVREVEAQFLDMIDAAQRYIYVENQFLTCSVVADRLAKRLAENPALVALIVVPKTYNSWVGEKAMLAGRSRFICTVRRSSVDRVRFVYPHVGMSEHCADVMVHSKIMIVDDRFLRVGSANLCNRSMGADTECDLTIEAKDASERGAIRRIMSRLLGEHCGAAPDCILAEIEGTGSLLGALDATCRNERQLLDLKCDEESVGDLLASSVEAFADPEEPIGPVEAPASDSRRSAGRRTVARIAKTGVLISAAIALSLLWRTAYVSNLTDPAALEAYMAQIAASPVAPVLVALVFIVAGLIGFPVTLLIAGTAVSFGAWLGFLYATMGAVLSAIVTYLIGRRLGSRPLRRLIGPRLNRIRRSIDRTGVVAVATIRLVPIAPFTLVNLVAGAFRVSIADYLVGTFLGLLPGIVILSLLGDHLGRIIREPTMSDAIILATLAAVWVAISLGLQLLLRLTRRRQ